MIPVLNRISIDLSVHKSAHKNPNPYGGDGVERDVSQAARKILRPALRSTRRTRAWTCQRVQTSGRKAWLIDDKGGLVNKV